MNSIVQVTFRFAALVGLAILTLAAGCKKKAASEVLARVGDQTITVHDFQAELQRRIANRQTIPDRQKLLEEMITRATLVQRARVAGLENAADVRRTFEDVLIAKLKESELEPKLDEAKVSSDEIKADYEREIGHFTQPAKAHLAIVYLAANSKIDTNQISEISARATEARRLALALPPGEQGFGKVAAQFSEDQVSRYRGGDAGWFTSQDAFAHWPKEVIATGFRLKKNGDVSDVIRAADGFYLVKKMDSREPVILPLAQVQGNISRNLLKEKRTRIEESYRQSLNASAKVQADLKLLSRIEYPTQSVASAAKSAPPALPSAQ